MATVTIRSITLETSRLAIELAHNALAKKTGLTSSALNPSLHSISTSLACKRRGVETRIIAGDRSPDPDQALIRALRNAHDWSEALKSGEPLNHLAQRVGQSARYIRRVTSLISLSPRGQSAILDGTQSADLNLETLVRGHIPLDWAHKDRLFEPRPDLPCSENSFS
jgi:hypothetical protein